jgi:hypothetical protein
MFFLKLSCCLLDTHALSALVVEEIFSLIQIVLLTSSLVFHVTNSSLKLFKSSFLLSCLVSHSFSSIFIAFHLFFQTLIFLLHFSHLSVKLFLLSERPTSLFFNLILYLLDFLSSEFWLSLHRHEILVIITCLLNLMIKLCFKTLDFFDIQ